MTTKTTGRAVIYGRVSQDVQRDNYFIPTQVALCLRAAQEHGYNVVGDRHVDAATGRDTAPGRDTTPAYVDDHSGTELLRPGVLALLEYLRTAGADAVFVLSLDRLARDPYIRQTIEREIEATGARVVYVQGGYSATPEGEVHKDLDGAFAKWENLKRAERSMRGKVAKAQAGKFPAGAPPYGYRLDKNIRGGLAVYEEEAAVVGRVFALYVQGESIRGIARTLTAAGIPPARCGTWTNATVGRILRKETYAGRAYFNRRQSVVTGDGITKPKRRKVVARESNESIVIMVTPIIDQSTFAQAQAKLDHNREAKRKQATRFYLLSGMVFCADCGLRYTVQTEGILKGRVREARQYRHRQTDGHCRDHLISAAILEPRVWAGVKRILLDETALAEVHAAALEAQRKAQAQAREHLGTLRCNLAKLDNRQDGLVRIYADGDITRAEYQAQRAELERERGELAAQAAELEANLATALTAEGLTNLQAFAAEVREVIESDALTEAVKLELLEKLAVRVVIARNGKATVSGVFAPFELSLLSTSSQSGCPMSE